MSPKSLRFTIAFFFFSLLTLTSCHKSFNYQIHGTLDSLPQVKELYLISDMAKGIPFDTIKVKGNHFDYEGKADSVTFCFLGNLNDSIALIPILLEEGAINVMISHDPNKLKVSGTYLNDEMQKLNEAGFKYQEEIQNMISEIKDDSSEEEKAQLEAKAMESLGKLAEIFYKTAEKNIENELGYFLVTNPEFLSEEQVMTLINKMPKSMRKRPYIKDMEAYIRDYSKGLNNIGNDMGDAPAVMPDFSAPDLNGKMVSAMDVVKQNKLTIIDFWASWCGPCMQEMPHMVQLYQLYHPHGLGILGVSLDTEAENWKNAVKQTGAVWTHISELKKNSEIARMFGINAIPFTLIVDKEGNVLASGLTGTELEDFIHQELGE